jgi:hypothetical protein
VHVKNRNLFGVQDSLEAVEMEGTIHILWQTMWGFDSMETKPLNDIQSHYVLHYLFSMPVITKNLKTCLIKKP